MYEGEAGSWIDNREGIHCLNTLVWEVFLKHCFIESAHLKSSDYSGCICRCVTWALHTLVLNWFSWGIIRPSFSMLRFYEPPTVMCVRAHGRERVLCAFSVHQTAQFLGHRKEQARSEQQKHKQILPLEVVLLRLTEISFSVVESAPLSDMAWNEDARTSQLVGQCGAVLWVVHLKKIDGMEHVQSVFKDTESQKCLRGETGAEEVQYGPSDYRFLLPSAVFWKLWSDYLLSNWFLSPPPPFYNCCWLRLWLGRNGNTAHQWFVTWGLKVGMKTSHQQVHAFSFSNR